MNKRKCNTCKYCGRITTVGIHCNYSLSGKTCITREGDKLIDRRGTDPNKCELYERG